MKMPTPEWVKAASREKRTRHCVICGTTFLVRSVDHVGRTCSKPCLLKHMGNLKRGTKQSPETIAKRAASLRKAWADPDRREARVEAARDGVKRWHSDPANAAAFSRRMSDRMKKLHQDPDWQKVRDARSSRTLKATWEAQREKFVADAVERHMRHREEGIGLWSAETIARKNEAAKWIMKRAQEAMHTETDYDATYTEVQARMRREMPYDGPQDGSEYMDYLQKLGRAVVSSPECRAIADPFFSVAIPRFAAEWNARRDRDAAPRKAEGFEAEGQQPGPEGDRP